MFIVVLTSAQYTFVKQWDYRYGGTLGDQLASLQQTRDGGFVLGGTSYSDISGDKTQAPWDSGRSDFWLVKLDNTGLKQWDNRYGGFGGDYLRSLSLTSDSGFIIAGDPGTKMTGDITEPGRGGADYWMIKVNSSGIKQWDKILGGNRNDYPSCVIQTNDGGYVVGGYSNSGISGDKSQPCWDMNTTYPFFDAWIVKIDSLGNKQWDKRYGGIDIDNVSNVKQTKDGGYILVGRSISDSSGDKTQDNWPVGSGDSYDGWIVKIDSLGNKQWDKRFGGSRDDNFGFVSETADGGYILAGGTTSPMDGDKTNAKWGYWLVKIDSEGNKEWDKAFEPGNDLFNMTTTLDGGFLLSGHVRFFNSGPDKSEANLSTTQSWVVKTDSLGNKQWDKTIFTQASDGGFAVQTSDGCFVVANSSNYIGGYKTQANWSDLYGDYWLLKFCMEPFNSIDDGQPTTGNCQLLVYPNPFTSDISIALTGSHVSAATYNITNLTGQTVYHKTESNLAPGYTKMLDLSYLPNGVYFVEVSTSEGKMVERVVKQ